MRRGEEQGKESESSRVIPAVAVILEPEEQDGLDLPA